MNNLFTSKILQIYFTQNEENETQKISQKKCQKMES